MTTANEVTPADAGMERAEIPVMTRDEIKAGDEIAFKGGMRFSSIAGSVVKANRVKIVISVLYMGRIPMDVTIRRANLDGEGRVKRDGVIYKVDE